MKADGMRNEPQARLRDGQVGGALPERCTGSIHSFSPWREATSLHDCAHREESVCLAMSGGFL